MLKKFFSVIIAGLMFMLLLCSCNNTKKVQTEESTTLTSDETTIQTYSEDELNKMVQDMPEIVFVFSHHYYYESSTELSTNILGYYITNTGEVKMYDFRDIAPIGVYDVTEVYDRLEEATCSELRFIKNPASVLPDVDEDEYLKYFDHPNVVTKEDLGCLPEDKVIECYKHLLLVTKSPEKIKRDCRVPEYYGDFLYYGVRKNQMGENEVILLGGRCDDYELQNLDSNSVEIINEVNYLFPDPASFYNIYNAR